MAEFSNCVCCVKSGFGFECGLIYPIIDCANAVTIMRPCAVDDASGILELHDFDCLRPTDEECNRRCVRQELAPAFIRCVDIFGEGQSK